MLVVSPTSVAAPCKLDDTAMAMSTGTGDRFSRRAMASPTGATISTVATLSTKALMNPASSASTDTAHRTSGTWAMSSSASRAGILLWIKRKTVPIIPAIISRTLKSTARAASASVKSYTPSFPSSRNAPAPPSATQGAVLLHRQHQNIKQDKQAQRQCHFVSSAGSRGFASSSIIR